MENKNKQIIYILGGPGSGKGTHCERLVRDFSFKHISIGDLMREEISSKSSLGSTIEAYVKNGEIVPTKTTIQLLTRALQKTNFKKYLIDGFPRGVEQALMLESTFSEIKFILNFNCSEEILVQRLLNRGLTSGRSDDNEETIRKRINTFNEQTIQALQLYQKFGKVTNILSEGSIEDVYKQVLPAIFPNVLFFYGAPVLGKSSVAIKLAERINYYYLDLHTFFEENHCQSNDDKVNKLMEYLLDHSERNFLIDDFFSTVQQLEVYFKHFIKPNKIFYFSATKDNVDNNIFMYKKTVKEQEIQMSKYQEFSISRKEILPALRKSGVLVELDACKPLDQIELEILGHLKPMIIFAQNSTESQFYPDLRQQLEEKEKFIELSMQFLIPTEISRGTVLGKQLSKHPQNEIPLALQLQLLRKIVFNNPKNERFLISGFPDCLSSYKQFESECCKIDYVMNCSDAIKQENQLKRELMLESYFNQTGRFFMLHDADIRFVQQYLVKRKQYAMVLGAAGMGKTIVSKALESAFGFVIPDYEKISTQLKEVLGGEDGPLEELTFDQLATQLKKNLDNQPANQLTLFDGFLYEDKELQQFIELMGDPSFIIIIKGNKDAVVSGFKRKNEMEADAEINEEDVEKIDLAVKQQQRICQYFETVKAKSVSVRIYEVDANQKPQKIIESAMNQFTKKMVVCNFNLSGLKLDSCWKVYSELLSNICTKNQIRFVDVRQLIANEFELQGPLFQEFDLQFKMRWSDTPKNFPSNYSPLLIISLIKQYLNTFQQPQSKVLLFGFPSGDNFQERKCEEQFFPRILDELNAIQTQLGALNSAFMVNDIFEQQEYDDPVQAVLKIVEEKPVAKPQGEDDEEKDKKEDDDDPEKKKKFNPDEYQWTVSDGNPKNFAQILAKNCFIEEQIVLEEKDILNIMENKINELFEDQPQKKFIQFLNCFKN